MIELLAPGFIFLGFAIAAVVMAGIVAMFAGINVPALLALFAVLSLIAWIGLRMVFRKQSSGARIVTRDINDN
jgi:membrane protein implicated in regulation of membrane protease activity